VRVRIVGDSGNRAMIDSRTLFARKRIVFASFY
jgi:hypothetical protein